ncbi:hypothetical protein [Nevskia soli]|uniref:hypothetical protein n=1 Tax=Nevskia soli TaxID=418856 RepID=UPI0004A764CC|nr:hypothetical protein [Nevskia soli]
MKQSPIADVVFRALLTNDYDTLREVQAHRAAECADLRAIVSTDHKDAIALDLGLGVLDSIYVTPILEGPRAFFMSPSVSVQARHTGGKSAVAIDYSLSFDSNFAEKLRAVLSGEGIQAVDRARVIEVLTLKAKNPRVQFDVLPFLYENVRLVRENAANYRPINTLIAFRMLDHLDWAAFQHDPGRFQFSAPAESLMISLRSDAETFLSNLYNDRSIVQHEAKCLGIQALLLCFARLWRRFGRRQVSRILHDLLAFGIDRLGAVPATELNLIWSGIRGREVSSFFGPIINPSPKMLKSVRGMAWDMAHVRLMEQVAQVTREGSFFVPYFVSMDERWRNLLRLNPIRLMVLNDMLGSKLCARVHEQEFQELLYNTAGPELRAKLSPEKVAARRSAARITDMKAMQELVKEEEQEWAKE